MILYLKNNINSTKDNRDLKKRSKTKEMSFKQDYLKIGIFNSFWLKKTVRLFSL